MELLWYSDDGTRCISVSFYSRSDWSCSQTKWIFSKVITYPAGWFWYSLEVKLRTTVYNLEDLRNTQLCMHPEKPPPAFIWLYIPLLLKSSFTATLHLRPTLCALCKSDQVENTQPSKLWLWKELAAGLWGGLVFNNVSHSDHELMRVFHPVKPNSLQLSHFIKNDPVNLSSTNVFWTTHPMHAWIQGNKMWKNQVPCAHFAGSGQAKLHLLTAQLSQKWLKSIQT